MNWKNPAYTISTGSVLTAGQQSELTAAAQAATVNTKIGTPVTSVSADIAAVASDASEIQAELADGGRTDLLIDAIKAKTDSLTFTQAGNVDANLQYVNDVLVNGTGATGDKWGP